MVEPEKTRLNKAEAAEYLGTSVRAVERFVTDKRLTPHYVKGKRGHVATYEVADLDRLKQELGEGTETLSPEHWRTSPGALARIGKDELEGIAAIFAEQIAAKLGTRALTTGGMPDPEKLVLTLAECRAVSGFSERVLAKAAKQGELKSIAPGVAGRGWRIRKTELLKWVEKLENSKKK